MRYLVCLALWFLLRGVLCCHALVFVSVFCFSVLFSIVTTSLAEEIVGLCTFRTFVCLFCTRQFLTCLSLPLGVRD